MSELAKLREEHAELVRLVRRLEAFVEQPCPPPQTDLFELRGQLNSTLIAHLKAEDWVLYPRLLASDDPAIARTAQAFNNEMGGLAQTYAVYAEKWTAGTIQLDWAGYCSESRVICDALSHRITRENRELYPLIERLDRAA
jgi:Hemerythrin HHE cation binding domain